MFLTRKLRWMKMWQVLSAWEGWGRSWQKRGKWDYLLKNLILWWEEPPRQTPELSTTKLSLIISPKTLKKSISSVIKEHYLWFVFRWRLRWRTLKLSSQSSFLNIFIFSDVLQCDKLSLFNNYIISYINYLNASYNSIWLI